MPFQNLNLHFSDPDAFRAWLIRQPAPQWQPIGSVFHNTFTPDEAQWRGHSSMLSMQRFYAAKGWTTGPHCYLASGTSADGVFVMCPPWLEGIHAGPCNPKRWGLEVVGNFQARPMSHNQLVLLSEATAALHDWQSLGPDIVAHRDCMPGRTCPGDAAYAQRGDVQTLLAFALRPHSPHYTEHSPLISPIPPNSFNAALQAMDRHQVPNPANPNQVFGSYTQHDVYRVIMPSYWDVCESVGLDPVLAWAQAMHETGWLSSFWAQRPRRNPAGIGVTGVTSDTAKTGDWAYNPADNLWHAGLSFTSWIGESIPAHLGRLLGYAVHPSQMNDAQGTLYAEATQRRPLPLRVLGCAPTLAGLEGTWAVPGTNYADRISAIANQLVEAAT